jgi:mitochondrial-processing peptidase subunit alpha
MYEPIDKRGICHLMDALAFRGSERFPAEDLEELFATHSISANAQSSRDVLMYKVDAFRGDIPLALSILADSVLRPRWTPDALEQARATAGFQQEAVRTNPSIMIQELMLEAAYGTGTAMGTSQYTTYEASQGITIEDVEQYARRQLRPEKMVISGAGVNHDELVRLAEAEFGHLRPFDPANEPESLRPYDVPDVSYKGGFVGTTIPLAEGQPGPLLSHASIVFPTVGWRDKRE